MLMAVCIFLYLLIVISLVWGRLYFFKLSAGTPRVLAFLYDVAVGCQIVLTLYGFMNVTEHSLYVLIVPFLYLLSLLVFWTAIKTAKSLDFAFSNKVGDIVTTGPFALVRHPFYTSYLLAWWPGTVFLGWPVLWISALCLTGFYVISAKKEERTIMSSPASVQYSIYQQQVGMFIPRIGKWKQSSSGH